MNYDVFFSISQTPIDGYEPTEKEMLQNFFDQVSIADSLGYKTAWIAQAHLSTQVQKQNKNPVVPHWKGEIGLCTDFFQLAHHVFSRTTNIEVGSAVLSILCNGGPIGVAERIANFCTLHGMRPDETRKLHIGFSAGRFEFMARPYGIAPRDIVEQASWPALRGQIFIEAALIMLHLLRGDVIRSDDSRETVLTRANFRSDGDWLNVQKAAKELHGLNYLPESVDIAKRFSFENLKIIPQDWPRSLLSLIVGSHDPNAQKLFNEVLPVKVFNLSITKPEIIDKTHTLMKEFFHKEGGDWKREYMPRTVMVFLHDDSTLSRADNDRLADKQARKALGAYWSALQGTIDPNRIENAANNALIGSVETMAEQISARYPAEDRLMLWFDFFNHDSAHVCSMMQSFAEKVVPLVDKLRGSS